MKYNVNMFEKIKTSLNKSSGSGGYKDMLKLEENKNYLIRLLPNIKDIDSTFFHYFNFGWDSVATGQYVSAVSPMSFGERCPINELRIKLYRSKNENDQALAKLIRRNEQWLVNCYVITNPTDPTTEGTVKILRYGKQLDKIFKDAIDGDDSDEYGPAVFDLSENGCNFRIKVENNEGGFKSYVSSRFVKASAIPGMTDDKIDQTYNSIHSLGDVFKIKTFEELEEMISVHLLNKTVVAAGGLPLSAEDEEDASDFPMDFPKREEKPAEKEKASKPAKTAKTSKDPVSESSIDDEINDLIKDL